VVLTSPDLISWVDHTPVASTGIVKRVVHAGGVYVAIGSEGVLSSTDGVTWRWVVPGARIRGGAAAWTGLKLVVVGNDGAMLSATPIGWNGDPACGIPWTPPARVALTCGREAELEAYWNRLKPLLDMQIATFDAKAQGVFFDQAREMVATAEAVLQLATIQEDVGNLAAQKYLEIARNEIPSVVGDTLSHVLELEPLASQSWNAAAVEFVSYASCMASQAAACWKSACMPDICIATGAATATLNVLDLLYACPAYQIRNDHIVAREFLDEYYLDGADLGRVSAAYGLPVSATQSDVVAAIASARLPKVDLWDWLGLGCSPYYDPANVDAAITSVKARAAAWARAQGY
jgi:hypothetical protein